MGKSFMESQFIHHASTGMTGLHSFLLHRGGTGLQTGFYNCNALYIHLRPRTKASDIDQEAVEIDKNTNPCSQGCVVNERRPCEHSLRAPRWDSGRGQKTPPHRLLTVEKNVPFHSSFFAAVMTLKSTQSGKRASSSVLLPSTVFFFPWIAINSYYPLSVVIDAAMSLHS